MQFSHLEPGVLREVFRSGVICGAGGARYDLEASGEVEPPAGSAPMRRGRRPIGRIRRALGPPVRGTLLEAQIRDDIAASSRRGRTAVRSPATEEPGHHVADRAETRTGMRRILRRLAPATPLFRRQPRRQKRVAVGGATRTSIFAMKLFAIETQPRDT